MSGYWMWMGAMVLAGTSHAQEAAGQQPRTETSLSLTYVWIDQADLDAGGEMGSDQVTASASVTRSLGRGESLGLSIGGTWRDYDFNGLEGAAPWGKVAEYDLGINWRRPVGDAGILMLAPSIQVARGEGADWSDSMSLGAVASYGYRFSDSLTLGFGVGIFEGLEETTVFPVLFVDWQINESWRVSNPFRPGPSGPAGLEIAYALSPSLELAAGGGWRSNRFRLDDSGPTPDGIGEVEGFPAFLRLTWRASETISVDLYGGIFLSGEVTLENANGHELASDDLDSAPLAALSVSGRF